MAKQSTDPMLELGSLEMKVMRLVWASSPVTVREVAAGLEPPLAYTTVMTTLSRLFRKEFLARIKSGRGFVYWPRMTEAEWHTAKAKKMLSMVSSCELLSLTSTMIHAIAQHDPALLDELKAQIMLARQARLENESAGP